MDELLESTLLFLLLLCLWYVFGGGLVGETFNSLLKVHQQIKVKDSRPNAAIFRESVSKAGPWLVPGNLTS